MCEHEFDLSDDYCEVVAGDGAFVLNFFEEEVEAVVAVFGAAFAASEEGCEKRLLFGVVADGVDGELGDKLQGVLLIEVVFQDFGVGAVEGLGRYKFSQHRDDLIDECHFAFVSLCCDSK